MNHRVFISRKSHDCEAIRAFLPSGVELIAVSLIETKAISFDPKIPPTDWIFFSSSNAARHFFEQKTNLGKQKIGAIGEATAKTIRQYRPVDFTGDAIDITDSAYRFVEAIGEQTVLFPSAADSLKHVQSALPRSQVIDLPVYTTTEIEATIPTCEVYVFSSPSNVRSFFKSNGGVSSTMKCIAFGEATQQELKKFHTKNILIPNSLEPHSIARAIIQALQG
ncbi:MAG: uroporphyrinogen-III synthase [Flavobacteriales bacterium]